MTPDVGPLLARGRDADVFDLGDGLVLRRARDGRSLSAEAAVMAAAHAGGVPVPRVHEVTADGAVVMDRVSGPTLQVELLRRPWRSRTAAGVLHALHEAVHAVRAPDALPDVGLPGSALLHLDLHPMNVLLGPDGPVLIDWANARRGPPGADLAMTWLILATSTVDGPLPIRLGVALLRRRILAGYEAGLDRAAAMAALPHLAGRRAADRNVGDAERRRLLAWVSRMGARPC
ncbi:phosphotransferase [Georgenia alba]|uniref:Phosphotransferase n=1 Tax=Georgenia alba TaxID=2233858 RepID=A0ABW2Q8Q8_9MICO